MGTDWKERIEELGIDSVIRDDRAFKARLAIGESAASGSQFLSTLEGTAGAASAGAALAATPMVASTLAPAGGILGALGLASAATPVGWIVFAAAASGLGYMAIRRQIAGQPSPTEVVPKFINSPIDLLAAQLFDLLAPLALKIAVADGEFHAEEMRCVRRHFTNSWGYDPAYVKLGIELHKERLPEFSAEDGARTFAMFCRENPDCNFRSFAEETSRFLDDLTKADGVVHESEERELELIRRAWKGEGPKAALKRDFRQIRQVFQEVGSSGKLTSWKERIKALRNDSVIKDRQAFKASLAIREDTGKFNLKHVRKLAAPVEVLGKFNSRTDGLAVDMFDLMAPLAVKVACADGEFREAKLGKVKWYFTYSWGYDPAYVESGIELYCAYLPLFNTEDVAKQFAQLCWESSEYNFHAIAENLVRFLEELTGADGEALESEVREVERIRQSFQEARIAGKLIS